MDGAQEDKILEEPKHHKWLSLLEVALFPAVFFYLEIVMAYSTGGSLLNIHGFYMLLFSIFYGLVLYFFSSLWGKEKVNRIIAAVCLFVMSFVFSVIYLLFCEFQLFYDMNTMLAGAADAVGSFSGDIFSILFSLSGFLHVLLFFIPFLLFLFFFIRKKEILKMQVISWKKRGIVGGAAVAVLLLLSGMFALDQPSESVYKEAYDYNTAIRSFGLATGLRLEVRHMLFPEEEAVSFERVEDTVSAMAQEGRMEKEEEREGRQPEPLKIEKRERVGKTIPLRAGIDEILDASVEIEYEEKQEGKQEGISEEVIFIPEGRNEMEIDFMALAEKDGGAYKDLDEYVASLQASSKNQYTGLFKGKNLIFLTAEAFSAEVIDKERTPTLYRMANQGIQFLDHYQPSSAGTTGGEYVNIFGMFPTMGGKSMKETETHLNWTTIGSRLSAEGYYGKAFHNNDYTFYDRDKTHINLGYSDGYEGKGNGLETVLSSVWPESDLEMLQGTFPEYADKQPFNIYYMTVSGHSLYTYERNAMARKNWDAVKDLPYSDPVKVYLGAQMELEAAMSYLLNELERRQMADDTVVVISADHFPYGLDQDSGEMPYLTELYGKPITNYFERDHNRLIIWSGCLEKRPPIIVDTPTTTVDILPTLCNLFDVEFDSRLLPGRDVFSDAEPIAFTQGYEWKTPLGTYTVAKGFVPVSEEVEIPEDYVKRVSAIVKNKISYCKGVLQKDYFLHIFGE